jgi:hypothetical protein
MTNRFFLAIGVLLCSTLATVDAGEKKTPSITGLVSPCVPKDQFPLAVQKMREDKRDLLNIYLQDKAGYEAAKKAGAKIVNIPELNTFFVYYVHDGFQGMLEKRFFVIQHEQNENAYQSLLKMLPLIKGKYVGVVSVQWKIPVATGVTRDLETDALYQALSRAADYLGCHETARRNLAVWVGFGKAASYAADIAFLDRKTGNKNFVVYSCISGAIDESTQNVKDMLIVKYGQDPLEDAQFHLWAGKNHQRGYICEKQEQNEKTLSRLGALIDRYKGVGEDTEFFTNPACFNQIWQLWCNYKYEDIVKGQHKSPRSEYFRKLEEDPRNRGVDLQEILRSIPGVW